MLAPISIGLVATTLVLALIAILQWRQLVRLGRRLDGIARGGDGRSLEAVLAANLERTERVGGEVDQLAARSAVIESDLRSALQRVGMVRFNPFEETGGNQSFALALMDARGTGFVVSSLHTRTGTRVYAKGITDGRAEGALSEEEREALRIALEAPAPTPTDPDRHRGRVAGPA